MTLLARIGRLALAYHIADRERISAKQRRAEERRTHLCDNERDMGDGHVEPYPCWQYERRTPRPVQKLCENCQHVQPYYVSYQQAAIKARVAKCRLTKALKEARP